MAFVDALVDGDEEADVVLVDRRHAPGGHWLDAYPFVRLHQPSANYGVDSTPLGTDRVDEDGPNRGFKELAGGNEICAYFDDVMRHHLQPSGRVRFFPMSEYVGEGRFRSLLTGDETEVSVRRRLVDATYLASRVPATDPPPFEVAPDATCVPIGDLARATEPPAGYVVVGGGKTSMDAVTWLLERSTSPDAITWIRPRNAWLTNRANFQPGEGAIDTFAGVVHELEAVAASATVDEAVLQAERAGVLLRPDPEHLPTMGRGPTVSEAELEGFRRVEVVVRLGHVRRIGPDRVVLAEGTIPVTPGHLHVHCASRGLPLDPPRPVFADDAVTVECITRMSPTFSAALTGYVESTERSTNDKNALLPPNPYADTPFDLLRAVLGGLRTEMGWVGEPDVQAWVDASRLNVMKDASRLNVMKDASRLNVMKDIASFADPDRLADLQGRFLEAAGPALARLDHWGAAAGADEQRLIWRPDAA